MASGKDCPHCHHWQEDCRCPNRSPLPVDEFIEKWVSKYTPSKRKKMKEDLEEMLGSRTRELQEQGILQKMASHKFNCPAPFHTDCQEWKELKASLESIRAKDSRHLGR